MKPIVNIKIKNGGNIRVELDPDSAPNTVDNFISLASEGFYDGIIFHRVISGFMIQGGDPNGTGMGGPGYSIKGEFKSNGFTANKLPHKRGAISMARSMSKNSAGSQFFIMHADAPYLDGEYAAFGNVIEGIEEVDKIAAVRTNRDDRPQIPQVIEKITLESADWQVKKPQKM